MKSVCFYCLSLVLLLGCAKPCKNYVVGELKFMPSDVNLMFELKAQPHISGLERNVRSQNGWEMSFVLKTNVFFFSEQVLGCVILRNGTSGKLTYGGMPYEGFLVTIKNTAGSEIRPVDRNPMANPLEPFNPTITLPPCNAHRYFLKIDRNYSLAPGEYTAVIKRRVGDGRGKPLLLDTKPQRFSIVPKPPQ